MRSIQGPKMRGLGQRTLYSLLLLAQLLNGTRAWAMPSAADEVDSLLAPGSEFSRAVVVTLVSNILEDADDEIVCTAEEAAKAAVVECSGEIAYQKSLAESWKAEAAKIDKFRGRWRNAALVEGLLFASGLLILGLTR